MGRNMVFSHKLGYIYIYTYKIPFITMLICTLNDAENWHGHLAAFEQAYVTVEGGNTFTEELNQGCMLWSMVYSRSIPLVSSD